MSQVTFKKFEEVELYPHAAFMPNCNGGKDCTDQGNPVTCRCQQAIDNATPLRKEDVSLVMNDVKICAGVDDMVQLMKVGLVNLGDKPDFKPEKGFVYETMCSFTLDNGFATFVAEY